MVFKKRIYSKWILSGEHSVLRFHPAIVYPLKKYYIDFSYEDTQEPFSFKKQEKESSGFDFTFLPLFEQALMKKILQIVQKQKKDLTGRLIVDSSIPFGGGLGASAILAVACVLLFEHKGWIDKKDLHKTAREIEDIFHKKSSGIDVAAVLEQKALLFQNGKVQKYLQPCQVQPQLYLSYSGRRSSTSSNVAHVEESLKKQPDFFKKIDEDMSRSVQLCLLALNKTQKKEMLNQFKQAFDLGENCFKEWNLFSENLKKHSQILKEHGALATKPTGSGLGGYVISLWDEAPSQVPLNMIPVSI